MTINILVTLLILHLPCLYISIGTMFAKLKANKNDNRVGNKCSKTGGSGWSV